MKLVPTTMSGLTLIEAAIHRDDRGESAKVVTSRILTEAGLEGGFREVLTARNSTAGTVRGLHFQAQPHQEAKTLWVTKGSLFDVVVDLRREQPTFGRWWGIKLDDGDGRALHIPTGFAHGYQTLSDETSLTYLISAPYTPDAARTLAWDDPDLAIEWPLPVTTLSDADRRGQSWSDLR